MRKFYCGVLVSLLPFMVALAQQRSGGDFLFEESKKTAKSVFNVAAAVFYGLPIALLVGVVGFAGWSFYRAYKEAKENRDENAVGAGVKSGLLALVLGSIGVGTFLFGMDYFFKGYIDAFMQIFRQLGLALIGG